MIDKVRIIRMSPANYSASKCREKIIKRNRDPSGQHKRRDYGILS